jgi:hypothetical protein
VLGLVVRHAANTIRCVKSGVSFTSAAAHLCSASRAHHLAIADHLQMIDGTNEWRAVNFTGFSPAGKDNHHQVFCRPARISKPFVANATNLDRVGQPQC